MKIQSALGSPSFLFSLDAEDLERLADACTPYRLAAGETIFKEGDPGESLFVILSGKVDVHVSSQDGEVVLDTLGPGDVLGEIAALDGKSRMAAATAAEITEIVVIERAAFHDFLTERPQVSGDEMLVDVAYWPDHIPGGVHLRAGLDWHPDPQVKRRYPNWDVQERSLKVTFLEQPSGPGLEVDFWIKFARSGDLAIRPGSMKVRSDAGEMLAMHFAEDQLLHMNEKIYESFAHSFAEFQNDRRVLPLALDVAIGTQLMQIEAAWREAVQR